MYYYFTVQYLRNVSPSYALQDCLKLTHSRPQMKGGYLEREPLRATVGWQARHSHSPSGMRYRAGRRQNKWKALLHSSQRISFSSSSPSSERNL